MFCCFCAFDHFYSEKTCYFPRSSIFKSFFLTEPPKKSKNHHRDLYEVSFASYRSQNILKTTKGDDITRCSKNMVSKINFRVGDDITRCGQYRQPTLKNIFQAPYIAGLWSRPILAAPAPFPAGGFGSGQKAAPWRLRGVGNFVLFD